MSTLSEVLNLGFFYDKIKIILNKVEQRAQGPLYPYSPQ